MVLTTRRPWSSSLARTSKHRQHTHCKALRCNLEAGLRSRLLFCVCRHAYGWRSLLLPPLRQRACLQAKRRCARQKRRLALHQTSFAGYALSSSFKTKTGRSASRDKRVKHRQRVHEQDLCTCQKRLQERRVCLCAQGRLRARLDYPACLRREQQLERLPLRRARRYRRGKRRHLGLRVHLPGALSLPGHVQACRSACLALQQPARDLQGLYRLAPDEHLAFYQRAYKAHVGGKERCCADCRSRHPACRQRLF